MEVEPRVCATVFRGHALQPRCPIWSWYCSTVQESQLTQFGRAQNCPAGHSRQAVLPFTALKLPKPQLSHCVEVEL